jgi:hypothetical protein
MSFRPNDQADPPGNSPFSTMNFMPYRADDLARANSSHDQIFVAVFDGCASAAACIRPSLDYGCLPLLEGRIIIAARIPSLWGLFLNIYDAWRIAPGFGTLAPMMEELSVCQP